MSHTGRISAFKSTSFMNSFKDLENAGQQAALYFENKAGQAWTTVNLALDCTIEFKNLKLKPWANINLEEGVLENVENKETWNNIEILRIGPRESSMPENTNGT